MADEIEDGGSAFPGHSSRGMTLRQHYAGEMMAALIASSIDPVRADMGEAQAAEIYADLAILMADALIAAEAKR